MELYLYLFILALAGLIAFELFVVWRKRKAFSDKENLFVTNLWLEIMRTVDRNPKNALMEADKLLDYVLNKKGYSGSLGEKLKKADKVFKDNNSVWRAHKLRNRLVHEVGFTISSAETNQAMSYFKQALCDLGIKF